MLLRHPAPTALVARVRWFLARHRWVGRSGLAIVMMITVARLVAAHDALDRARTNWGRARTVWVASGTTAAGARLVAHAQQVPLALVPDAAIDSLPADGTAAHHVAKGAILTTSDLRTRSALPADWVVFTISADTAPTLRPGDTVALYASGAHLCDGRAVTASGSSGSSTQVEVGVARNCAAAVGDQLGAHAVEVARVTPG